MGQAETQTSQIQTMQGLWLFIPQPLLFIILNKQSIRKDVPGHRDVCRSIFISEMSYILYSFVRGMERQKE